MSLLPRKTKSLREIYQDERYDEDYDESVNFALFSHSDPIYFEEAVNEEKWCNAMDYIASQETSNWSEMGI